jgi:predicted ferric reductase
VTSHALWYLSRGTGVVSLGLLTIVVVLGVLTHGNVRAPVLPRFVVSTLHRNAALMAVGFLGVHILTAVADPYAPIRLLDAVVPFVSAYRPVWLGLGALALDLLAAIVVTSLLRRRIGLRSWRAVHLLAYAAWPVALVHGLGTGTDTRQSWMLLFTVASVAAVVVAVLWRSVGVVADPSGRRIAMAGAALLAPLALVVWLRAGPLAPGWAARAGTPGVASTPAAAVAPRGDGAARGDDARQTQQAGDNDDDGHEGGDD